MDVKMGFTQAVSTEPRKARRACPTHSAIRVSQGRAPRYCYCYGTGVLEKDSVAECSLWREGAGC